MEFKEGLNILSGETGAGKSIIIGSVNLALGEKVPKEMLREHAQYALVELVFGVENEYQRKQLLKLDVTPEDGQVILTRRITAARSVGRINSESVPASKMRQVASLLIDIHGQHEHQSLLHASKHLEILDAYAKEAFQGKREALREAYLHYLALKKEQAEALTYMASGRGSCPFWNTRFRSLRRPISVRGRMNSWKQITNAFYTAEGSWRR